MDTSALIPKLEAIAPGAVLEAQPFGRSGETCIWVEMRALLQLSRALKDDRELKLDWLENLSAMEMNQAIVLTYFLRSQSTGARLIVRGSVIPASAEAVVDVPSIVTIWPMGMMQEREIADLFGVRFLGNLQEGRTFLPEGWAGFPLRKSYIFPTEYSSIPHMRRVGQTLPDEYGVPK